MSMPLLPFEIIEQIIEELPARPDRVYPVHATQFEIETASTLKSTALLCTHLRDVAQKRLFEHITLSGLDSDSSFSPFTESDQDPPSAFYVDQLRGLASSPQLLSYVRSIHIVLPNTLAWTSDTPEQVKHIVKILQMVQSRYIRYVKITGGGFLFVTQHQYQESDNDYREGRRYTAWTLKAINRVLQSQSLVELDIEATLYDSILQATTGACLKTLTLSGPTFSTPSWIRIAPIARTRPIVLETLVMDSPKGLGEYFLNPDRLIDLRSLKHLTVTGFPHKQEYMETLQDILDVCGSSLETLHFEGDDVSRMRITPRSAQYPDISGLDSLRHLRYSWNVDANVFYVGGSGHDDFIDLVGRCFTDYDFPPSLETLAIHPQYTYPRDSTSGATLLFVKKHQWAALGEALSTNLLSRGRLPRLKSVEIVPRLLDGRYLGRESGAELVGSHDLCIALDEGIEAGLSCIKEFGIQMLQQPASIWRECYSNHHLV